jgi:hypothetical protein
MKNALLRRQWGPLSTLQIPLFDEIDYKNPNEDIAQMALQYGTVSNMVVGRQEASSDSPSTVFPFRSPQQAHEFYMLLKALLSGNYLYTFY